MWFETNRVERLFVGRVRDQVDQMSTGGVSSDDEAVGINSCWFCCRCPQPGHSSSHVPDWGWEHRLLYWSVLDHCERPTLFDVVPRSRVKLDLAVAASRSVDDQRRIGGTLRQEKVELQVSLRRFPIRYAFVHLVAVHNIVRIIEGWRLGIPVVRRIRRGLPVSPTVCFMFRSFRFRWFRDLIVS